MRDFLAIFQIFPVRVLRDSAFPSPTDYDLLTNHSRKKINSELGGVHGICIIPTVSSGITPGLSPVFTSHGSVDISLLVLLKNPWINRQMGKKFFSLVSGDATKGYCSDGC